MSVSATLPQSWLPARALGAHRGCPRLVLAEVSEVGALTLETLMIRPPAVTAGLDTDFDVTEPPELIAAPQQDMGTNWTMMRRESRSRDRLRREGGFGPMVMRCGSKFT